MSEASFTSDLLHRIQAAEREAFGLADGPRSCVEEILEQAREEAVYSTDPDLNDAWRYVFEAEVLLGERGSDSSEAVIGWFFFMGLGVAILTALGLS